MAFEFLDHTGDTAVALSAASEAELFQEAARALLSVYLEDPAEAARMERVERPLRLESSDGVGLLVDFLAELIYLFDTEGFLCYEVDVRRLSLGPPALLDVRLRGGRFDPSRHHALTEVKAVTYHDLEIERTPAGLTARVVFDL